jgi:hypothetical protein
MTYTGASSHGWPGRFMGTCSPKCVTASMGEVRTWVSSRRKNPCRPGQLSVEINRDDRLPIARHSLVELGVDFEGNESVRQIDLGNKRLRLANGDERPYEKLLRHGRYSTTTRCPGRRPARPPPAPCAAGAVRTSCSWAILKLMHVSINAGGCMHRSAFFTSRPTRSPVERVQPKTR